MNRQQRRVVHKLSGEELKAKERDAMLRGVKGTMAIFTKVMKEQEGYGKVRLKRIEDAMKKELGMEVE